MIPFRSPIRAAFVAAALIAAAPALALDAGVLATVDGVPLTAEDVKAAEPVFGVDFMRVPAELRAKEEAGRIVDTRLLAAQALRAGLDKSDTVRSRLDEAAKGPAPAFSRDQALATAYLEQIRDAATFTDADLKALYDEASAQKEFKARHILVPTREEADAALARIRAGADFSEVAKEVSKDPGSGPKGGDLGWFPKAAMVPEFGNAVDGMKAGEIGGPIKSPFGWHVIALDETRSRQLPPFEAIKLSIKQFAVQRLLVGKVKELRAAAKIEWNGPAPQGW